jgi:outer membrane protein, heavy metal efflux system
MKARASSARAMRARLTRIVITTATTFALAATARAEGVSDSRLEGPVDRLTLVVAAVARSPAVRAAVQEARVKELEAEAVGRLPPPEATVWVWQVPLSRPYALNNQMLMVGLTQSFPAPGSLGAREEAKGAEARAELAMADDASRQLVKDVEHTFASYVEATSHHRVHRGHREVAERVLALARSRHATGGSLEDVAQAEVELSKVDSDIVTDAAQVEAARARLNALLLRDPGAPLGPPTDEPAAGPGWDVSTISARARALRPELRAAEATLDARRLEARASSREATWPSFSVSALYFAPTSALPFSSYGFQTAVSLPWLWGAAGHRHIADEQRIAAAATSVEAARAPIDADVAGAEATARSAAQRLQVLRDRTLPASKRSLDVTMTGYESSRTDILMLLTAWRSVIDAEEQIVMARASLDHALADLDAAVGMPVPRIPLGPFEEASQHGGDHAH